jgi:hypothetical protein
MKKYELQYTKGETGVFRMSTVESPATRTTLVMFDDESKLLQFADEEKQVIYSVAMRPNILIPRKDINGEPAMVFYSEETVENLQQNFFKNNSHNGATINHDGKIRSDMYIFESWIVMDAERDKAAVIGMDVRKGDLVMAQKVDNPEVWADIKSGKLQGFSIEAYLEPVLTEEKKIEMTDEEFNARVKKVLMAEALGDMYMVGEKAYYLDKKEIGGLLTDIDGVPFASITETIDGLVMTTDENGFVIDAVPFVEEDAEEEAKPDMTKMMDDLQAENNDLKAQIVSLKEGNTMMSKENAAIKKVSIEMTEELKKGLKPASDGKNVEEMSALERYRDKKNK